MFFSTLLWVQVPQWSDNWSKCAVDIPDTACHWYVVSPDNTFGRVLIRKQLLGLMRMA